MRGHSQRQVWSVLSGGLFLAVLLQAAPAAASRDSFEASVVGGYRWGGSGDIDKGSQDGRITADSAMALGASVGYRTQPDGWVYLWYSRQDTTLHLRPRGVPGPHPTRDVSFEYYHFGGYLEGSYGPTVPYLGLSVGLTRMGAADVGDEWRFSMAGEVGFKVPITSFIHLRLLGRAPVTFMTGNTEIYCITPQGCGVSLVAKPIVQAELMGGVGVNF